MSDVTLTTPVTEAAVRALRAGDMVTLEGTLFGIRDATLIHLFDRGRTTRFDLAGHAVLHTAPNVRKVERSPEFPAGYAPVCIGTTTSMRMERFTRPLMERCGVRIIVGKGGMGEGSLAAFRELGGVYLAIIGGVAALAPWRRRRRRGCHRRCPSRPAAGRSRECGTSTGSQD